MQSTETLDSNRPTPTDRVAALIAEASKRAGSQYKLAKMIHRSHAELSQWKAGVRACPVQAQALMAEVAGLKAAEVALYAVIEAEKDPERKEALARVLGKGLVHTIAAASCATFASGLWGSEAYSYLIRCILC